MSKDIPDHEADKFLNWLCWTWAQDGERFYPPDETAEECIEAVRDGYEEEYSGFLLSFELTKAFSWEEGQHARAYDEARFKFKDAENWGFDPVERAARYHYNEVWTEDNNVEKMDWEWYNE